MHPYSKMLTAQLVSDSMSVGVIRYHHTHPHVPLFMRGVIQDNLSMLFLMFGLVVFLVGLCVCAFLSMQASTRRSRFWFSVAPILFGLIGVWAQIPISIERGSFHLHFDFSWLFLIPLLLGGVGFISYLRARHEHLS